MGSLQALNLAMLGKWWWRECNEPDAKWVKIVKLCNSPKNGNNRSVWNVIKSIDGNL